MNVGQLKFIETHCHLDYLKDKPLDVILDLATQAQVEKIITIAVSKDNLQQVLEIGKSYSQVFVTQGIHPHSAKDAGPEIFKTIQQNIQDNKKVVAVGEIGLDYHYDNSPRDIQRQIFESQLQLACELDLPVVIHSRDAEEDTIDILNNFLPRLKKRGVIHSFTSKINLAEFVLKHDFMIGFNGIITFINAHNVRLAVEITPVENIVFETDAPFLTPEPNRGKENGPYYLPLVAQKVAELKSMPLEEIAQIVYQNSHRLFNL